MNYSLPMRLFSTAVRATAVGLILAASRIASVVAAAEFPLLLKYFNVTQIFEVVTEVLLIGLIFAVLSANREN